MHRPVQPASFRRAAMQCCGSISLRTAPARLAGAAAATWLRSLPAAVAPMIITMVPIPSGVTSVRFAGSCSGAVGSGLGFSVMLEHSSTRLALEEGEAADQPARCRWARCLHAVEQPSASLRFGVNSWLHGLPARRRPRCRGTAARAACTAAVASSSQCIMNAFPYSRKSTTLVAVFFRIADHALV
jgi:hypothetical protein